MASLVVGYARVSSDEQADALPAQIARLQAAGCDQIISDVKSGRQNERDGLLELMDLVRRGEVREVVVDRLDRLGRDAAYADTLLAQCCANNVTVRALVGGIIETETPQGFLMARLQTSLAEMESRMLSLRIRRQFAVYRTQGRHLRRRKPFGYQGGPDHKLIPHPEQWPHALRVIEELRMIRSFSGVASRMPYWCPWSPAPGCLQAWFCNPVIRGHIGYNLDKTTGKGWRMQWETIHYNQHEPLIEDKDWEELKVLLQQPKNKFRNSSTTEIQHGLTGLLRCASCGHLMRRNTSVGVAWWRCRHRMCQERGGIKETEILPFIAKTCVAHAKRFAEIAATPDGPSPELVNMEKELELMQEMATRNPDNKAMAAAVKEQLQKIEALKHMSSKAVDLDAFKYMTFPEFFTDAKPQHQRMMFSAVLRSVSIGPRGLIVGIQARTL